MTYDTYNPRKGGLRLSCISVEMLGKLRAEQAAEHQYSRCTLTKSYGGGEEPKRHDSLFTIYRHGSWGSGGARGRRHTGLMFLSEPKSPKSHCEMLGLSYSYYESCWFRGGSDSEESACVAGDAGSIPGSGRSPGEGMAPHSSILAWRIPWTEEPGRESDMTEWLTFTY